ncbi:MAG: hypothetical protein Q9180_001563, partial [Flavoplaca navasiana]
TPAPVSRTVGPWAFGEGGTTADLGAETPERKFVRAEIAPVGVLAFLGIMVGAGSGPV